MVVFFTLRRFMRREAAFKSALETNQKRLDYQTARINILTRALPTLQSLINKPQTPEDWKTLCLDEGRAMLRADSAHFWRFLERDQKWELELSRGAPSSLDAQMIELQAILKKRSTVVTHHEEANLKAKSTLTVPLMILNEIKGAFQFERLSEERLTQRDGDLMTLFVRQLSLSLENRDMVKNRETFYLELVQALADTLDSRDSNTQGQTRRARSLARGIAKVLDLPEEFAYALQFAALLHDIGNIAIDDQLLKKPGKLTPDEFSIVKKHPELGYKIIAPVSILAPVAPMILYHQERFDGTGYPEGLKGEEIPLGARIVAILDAWIAMTTSRSWRQALSKEEAIREIKKGVGTQFDPVVVEAFLIAVENQRVDAEVSLR